MFTCIARSKQDHSSPTKQTNMLSSQIKDMYRNCAPCVSHPRGGAGETSSAAVAAGDKLRWSYRRSGSSRSNSSSTAGRRELQERLKGITTEGAAPPPPADGRRVDPVLFVEEEEEKEWVAQVEPGVLITFVSLPRGGNDLKQIKFSREMFKKLEAQEWWEENCEKVMELYNVQRLNRQAFPLPSTPTSQHNTKMESVEANPIAPPRILLRPTGAGAGGYPSSESFDPHSVHARSTPNVSNASGAKVEKKSLDASMRTSSSTQDANRPEEMSISNASFLETEWIEEDEPGVYLTVRVLPDGRRELRRVRFSREKFGEMHARVWWEENRERIHKQYL